MANKSKRQEYPRMLEGITKLLKHKPFYAKLFSRYDTTKNNLFGVMREQHNKFFADMILKQQYPDFANGFNFCHSVFNNLEIVKDKR